MQQIIYRELPVLPDKELGDMSGDPRLTPIPEEVAGLCGMMQTWAHENGWRIASITPVAGTRVRYVRLERREMPVHTVGFIFVCDKL